jgi:hypothetical protein
MRTPLPMELVERTPSYVVVLERLLPHMIVETSVAPAGRPVARFSMGEGVVVFGVASADGAAYLEGCGG